MQGWKKLNTDGSCSELHDLVGCGGVMRDEDGQWVAGSVSGLGSPTALPLRCRGCVRASSCAAI